MKSCALGCDGDDGIIFASGGSNSSIDPQIRGNIIGSLITTTVIIVTMVRADNQIIRVFICGKGGHFIQANSFAEFESAVMKITEGKHDYHYELYDGSCWIRVESDAQWKLASTLFPNLKRKNDLGCITMRVVPRCPFFRWFCGVTSSTGMLPSPCSPCSSTVKRV